MGRHRFKRYLKWALWGGLGIVALLIAVVGPWPTYSSAWEGSSYLAVSLEVLSERRAIHEAPTETKSFLSGWKVVPIVPPEGTPLAGYGARKGASSTGMRQAIFVKALALSDGEDTAIVVGSDLLIVPENIADQVRETIADSTDLSGEEILFNASHNHSGPGGFAPGWVSGVFNGPYRPDLERHLVSVFVEAIEGALRNLEPSRLGGGGVEAPELIRNRERSEAPVDSEVSFLLFEQRGGARCLLVSYSAHPTIIGSQNLEFTGDYPGFLMQHLSALGEAEVIYLGGAVGSMGHRAPEGESEFERAELMGKRLAERVHEALGSISLNDERSETNVEVIGMPMVLPPYQVRLNRELRFSKHLLPLLGVDHDAWLQGVRIGRRVMVGTPADFCGEISVALKREAAAKAIDLWVLSFNGDYVGYISPDQYYRDLEPDGSLGYERGVMSWIGPDQEAYLRHLINELVSHLFP